LTIGESPNLINVDWSEDGFKRRGGTKRKAGPLRIGSIRLDGRNDYLRITNQTVYDPTGLSFLYNNISVLMRTRPTSAKTVMSQGFGAAADLFQDLRYDPTAGTGAAGAWVYRVRDSSGAVTVTLTVDDAIPEGKYRFIHWTITSFLASIAVVDETGANVGTDTQGGPAAFNWNAAQDIFIGVGTTALNTIGTDFIDATVAEFRYWAGNTNPATLGITPDSTNKFYIREMNATIAALLLGYWKMNDGDDKGVCADSSPTNNPAVIVNQTAPWVRSDDNPLVLGPSAVRFVPNSNGWCDLRDTTVGTTTVQTLFQASGGVLKSWSCVGIYIPELPTGAATVPDGVIYWFGQSGASPPLPSPCGLRIVSDRFEARYNDNGVNVSLTMTGAVSGGTAPTVTSLAGKRVRWVVGFVAAPTPTLVLQIVVDNGAGVAPSAYMIATTGAPFSVLGPSVISQDVSIGKRVTNFAQARLGSTSVFGTDGTASGIIDDVLFLNGYSAYFATNQSLPNHLQPFQEQTVFGGIAIAMALRLNDGAGTGPLQTSGLASTTSGGWQAYLRPEIDEGARWDVGLVDPQVPARGSLCRAYDRFANDRKPRRGVFIASGTTLYYNDFEEDTLKIVGPLPAKADVWTAAQYGQRTMFAGAPGRQPVWSDGAFINNLGIAPPKAQPIVALTNAAGSFLNGTYFLYVTYKNKSKPFTESNPSPGVAVTFAGADDTIDSVAIPVSPDPQVNQRRIWMTLLGGADGSPAYLVATVDDNTTTSYTTDILSVSNTSEAITDYFGRAPAPEGTIIAQFKDYTLIGGSQEFPTRLYFSAETVPDYWKPDDGTLGGDWLDLDLDAGRAITAIKPLLDSALVDFTDGRAVITTTGDTDDPLAFSFSSRSAGAVGPQAIATDGNIAYVINENGITATTGYDDESLSGPEERAINEPRFGRVATTLSELERSSILGTMLKKVVGTGRRKFAAAFNRAKRQVFFAIATTDDYSHEQDTNGSAMVYDIERRVWSRYDVAIDCADVVDDATGNARLWGVVDGYLCEIDADNMPVDGVSGTTPVGTVSSVSGQAITVSSSVLGAAGGLRFLTCYVYKVATNTVVKFQLRDNTSGTVMVAADGVDLSGIANGDSFVVGGIPCWIEFAARHGAALDKKRFRWLRLYGENSEDTNYLRVAYKVDENRFDPSITGWTNEIRAWPLGTPDLQVNIGGVGGLVRVRLGEHSLATGTPIDWMPAVKRLSVATLEVLAEPLDVL
jgi:hypothetical protein